MATPVAASHDHDEALQAVKSGEIRPLAEILNIVRDKLPGEVVRTELERKEGQWVYEIRVIDNKGKLFEVYVDARSGEIKRMRKK
ncbi:MAG: PepSY domain-containing protein [Burkholderiales bacterium]|nr:PepSY domain-containing protein [Burkholderiales bacterium]